MEPTTDSNTESAPVTVSTSTVSIRDIAHRVCATAMVIVVAAVCGLSLFSAVFVGAGALWDPSELVTLEQWTRSIGFTAQSGTAMVIATAMALAVVVAVTVVAAWRHQRTWFIAGVISGALTVATLVFTSTVAFQSLNSVIAHTHDRIGTVKLTTEIPERGDEPGDGPDQAAPIAVTQAAAEAEVMRLVAAIEVAGVGPLTPIDSVAPGSIDVRLPNPGAIPLQSESCFPDSGGQVGNQIGATFEVPSDAEGTQLRATLTAWESAGYSVTDRLRDTYMLGGSGLPIQTARVNDSFTIDGNIRVTISSVCASTTTE